MYGIYTIPESSKSRLDTCDTFEEAANALRCTERARENDFEGGKFVYRGKARFETVKKSEGSDMIATVFFVVLNRKRSTDDAFIHEG